ncbi:hypothetical protein AB4124_21905 [Paenibacillus sp. 2KB_20]|uniref:hypothetical protein n=1 Tax=Paenibacillus sp. 2KB_20 TaxID=3232977 RepID=UPI003F9735A2
MNASFINTAAAPPAPTLLHAGLADRIRAMRHQAMDRAPLAAAVHPAAAGPLAGVAVAAAAAAKLQT